MVVQLDGIRPRQRYELDGDPVALDVIPHFRFLPAVELDSVQVQGGIIVALFEKRRSHHKEVCDCPQHGRIGPAHVDIHEAGGRRAVGNNEGRKCAGRLLPDNLEELFLRFGTLVQSFPAGPIEYGDDSISLTLDRIPGGAIYKIKPNLDGYDIA